MEDLRFVHMDESADCSFDQMKADADKVHVTHEALSFDTLNLLIAFCFAGLNRDG